MRPYVVGAVLAILAACTTVPEQEFQDYTTAFAEVKSQTERLLTDYDAAKKADTKLRQPPAAPAAPRRYPATIDIQGTLTNQAVVDDMTTRRRALEVIDQYNKMLTDLAAGKSPEEMKKSVGSLLGNVQELGGLLQAGFSIPYIGPLVSLLSTFATELQNANNRSQFVAAMRTGAPIITEILHLFAADAEDFYLVQARLADRRWTPAQDTVATLVRQMRGVAAQHAAPAGALASRRADVEKRCRELLDAVDLKANSASLATTGSSAFTDMVASQLEQTLAQADTAAKEYQTTIAEQAAYYTLVASYGKMLRQTQVTLDAVRAALDARPDLHAQAMRLIDVAFSVKRDWAAIAQARRAPAST